MYMFKKILKKLYAPSFKFCIDFSEFIFLISIILNCVLFYMAYQEYIKINLSIIREFADFTVSFLFASSAMGFTIFTLIKKKESPQKKDLILSYVGRTILLASISVFCYCISYFDFLNLKPRTLGCLLCLPLLVITLYIESTIVIIKEYLTLDETQD